MDIRAVYDWTRRLTEWLDSDITAFTIKHAVAFAIVWWLSRGFFRGTNRQVVAPDPVSRCLDRGGADQVFVTCMSRMGQSANCDLVECGARAA